MGLMTLILAVEAALVIAVVVWLHRVRSRADRLARALADMRTERSADKRLLADAATVKGDYWALRVALARIAAMETAKANATVKRMAATAQEALKR